MKTMEIPEGSWAEFCSRVQKNSTGAMISIQITDSAGAVRAIAEEIPLQGVYWERGECNDQLTIDAGPPNERPLRHVVLAPIHLRLKDGCDDDRYNQWQIVAENGTTLVTIHPGLKVDFLKGSKL